MPPQVDPRMTSCTPEVNETRTSAANNLVRNIGALQQNPGARPTLYSYHQDPDWIADVKDYERNSAEYRQLWLYFRCRHLRRQVPAEAMGKFALKFSRCRRIEAKWGQIEAQFRAEQKERLRRLRLIDDSHLPSRKTIQDITASNIEKVQKDLEKLKRKQREREVR